MPPPHTFRRWDFLSFVRQLSVLRLLGIDASTVQAFVGMWAIAAIVVAVALMNAAYVAYQVRVGFSGSLMPVRTLRAAVTILLTAAYVPLVEVLAEPLSCARLQQRSLGPQGGMVECYGTLHATLFGLSLPILVGFVTFALLMRSVYFADAPLSGAIMAKPIARNEFWDTVARTTLVLLALFLPRTNPMLMTGLFVVMYLLLTVQALLHLPYFKLAMTQLRVATYCSLVWLALGGFVAQAMRPNPATELTAAVWIALTPVVLIAGALGALWRQRWMERKGASIARFHVALQAEREAMEAEMREAQGEGSVVSSGGPQASVDSGAAPPAAGDRFLLPTTPPKHKARSPVGRGALSPGAEDAKEGGHETAWRAGIVPSVPPEIDTSTKSLFPGGRKRRPSIQELVSAAGRTTPASGASPHGATAPTGALAAAASVDTPPRGTRRRLPARTGSGQISAAAAVAHRLGGNSMRFRKGKAREAEDVTELLGSATDGAGGSMGDEGSGFTNPLVGSGFTHPITGLAMSGGGGGGGTTTGGRDRRRRRSSLSKDDDSVLSTTLQRRAARAQSRRAMLHATKLDDEEDTRGAFVTRREPTEEETAAADAANAAEAAAARGPPGSRGVRRGGSAARSRRVSAPDAFNAVASGSRRRSVAGGSYQADDEAAANVAVSSFVAALRSELGHTSSSVVRGAASRRASNAAARPGAARHAVADASDAADSGGAGRHASGRGARVAFGGALQPAPRIAIDPLVAPEDKDEELDELLSSGPDPSSLDSHASHIWSSDTDVELYVRALLARPTQRRLTYARALLDEALRVFPDSVFVRLTFTTYLFSRSATYPDILLAMRLLAEASTIPAPLDLRFAVFSKLNSAINARRRLVLGDGQPGMRQDSLDLVEFKKGVKRAGDKHREAVSLLLAYWTSLAHGGSDGITIRERTVTETVSSIIKAADEAEKSYLSVLERWPSSQQVQRAYGIFLINVRNDKDMGEAYLSMGENTDEDMAGGTHGGSSAGGSRSYVSKQHGRSGASVGMRSSRSGTSLTSVENIKRRKLRLGNNGSLLAGQLSDITRMRNGFRLGLLALLAIIVAMFVLSGLLFLEIRLTVQTMSEAGLRRSQVHAASYNVRGQRLAAVENNSAAYRGFQLANLKAARTFHAATEHLYFEGPRPAGIDELWVEPRVRMGFFNPDPPPGYMNYDRMGLLDASNLYVTKAARVARLNMSELQATWNAGGVSSGGTISSGDPYYTMPEYRFTVGNAPSMIAALEGAADLYQEGNVETALVTDTIMFALTGVRFFILTALAWCVVLPAVAAIRGQKLVLRTLVLAVPRKVASHMASRLKRVNSALSEVNSLSSSLEEIDPTTRLYTTLRDSTFLVTLPRSKSKSRSKSGRPRPGQGQVKVAAAAGAGGAASPAAGVVMPRDDPMYAIPEEESDADEGSPGAHPSTRIVPMAAAGALGGSLRYIAATGGGSVLPGGPGLRHSADSKQIATKVIPPAELTVKRKGAEPRGHAPLLSSRSSSDGPTTGAAGGVEAGRSTRNSFQQGEGDGNLVDELDLLESVHDADELAALMTQRRDAKTIRDRGRRGGAEAEHDSARADRDASDGPDVSGHSGDPMDAFHGVDDLLAGSTHTDAADSPTGAAERPPSAGRAVPTAWRQGGVTARGRDAPAGAKHHHVGILRVSGPAAAPGGAVATDGTLSGRAGTEGSVSSLGQRLAPPSSGSAVRDSGVTVSVVSKQAPAAGESRNSISRLRQTFADDRDDGALAPASARGGSGARCCLAPCCPAMRCAGRGRSRRRLSASNRPGHASSSDDDEAGRKLGVCTNASLRSLVVRASLVMTALVALMAATTVVIYTFATVTASKAAQLNNAGRRRSLATKSVADLRELILADGQLGTVAELAAAVDATLKRYQRIHDGLRLGDPGLGLPKRDPSEGETKELTHLYYGSPGQGFTLDETDPLGIRDYDAVGLDPMVRHFWATARRVLTTFANASTPRPPRTLTGLLSVPQFRVVWEMERGPLQQKQQAAVQYYTTADTAVVDSLEVQAYIVLSVEVVVLAVAYLMVYEGISSALVSEHMRAKDIRDLIPSLIRQGTPELHRAFETVDDGSNGSSRVLGRR